MNIETRQTIYMGINFIFTPMPGLDRKTLNAFQNALDNAGVEFKNAEQTNERQITVTRETPTPLNISISAIPPALGQLIVISPRQGSTMEMFIKEIEAVINAYGLTWPVPGQVIHTDATFRDLFESTGLHAFQELWEDRLKQPKQALNPLGRPVLGGGLRLVMPPQPNDPTPTQIEVKIESYLQDSRKFFIETTLAWPQSLPPGVNLNPQLKLKQLDEYIEKSVLVFARGDQA